MDACVHGWMDGWKDGWTDGRMDLCINGCMHVQRVHTCLYQHMKVSMSLRLFPHARRYLSLSVSLSISASLSLYMRVHMAYVSIQLLIYSVIHIYRYTSVSVCVCLHLSVYRCPCIYTVNCTSTFPATQRCLLLKTTKQQLQERGRPSIAMLLSITRPRWCRLANSRRRWGVSHRLTMYSVKERQFVVPPEKGRRDKSDCILLVDGIDARADS